jgi:hypothetical protein
MTLSLLAGIDTHGDDGELESDQKRSEALVAVAKKKREHAINFDWQANLARL